MRLADDIALPDGVFSSAVMRPSLRAAFRLEQRYGFERLVAGITEGNLGIIADVIAEGAALPRTQLFQSIDGKPLGSLIGGAAEQLLRFAFALAGIDPDKPKANTQGERVTFAEYHARLFRIATGWLGWTPENAWNATPAEIMTAYEGRVEMLGAIFGKADDAEQSPTEPPDQAQLDRAGFAELKRMVGR